MKFIANEPQNRDNQRRIFATEQGSADAACQEGTQGGADAVPWQKDKLNGTVLGFVGYTPAQEAAIYCNAPEILVSAAAGSGKTAVLTERILRHISNNIGIDRLLVVTFTEAAAAEMKERVTEKIHKLLEPDDSPNGAISLRAPISSRHPKLDPNVSLCHPGLDPGSPALCRETEGIPGQARDDGNGKPPIDFLHLSNQAALLSTADISTIHAFCRKLVKEHFQLIDIDPAFRVADDAELAIIKSRVMDEVFEDAYNQDDNAWFLDLVDVYGGKAKDDGLDALVRRLYAFLESDPFPLDAANRYVGQFEKLYSTLTMIPLDSTPWAKLAKQELTAGLDGILEGLRRAMEVCGLPGGPEKYIDQLENDEVMILTLKKDITDMQFSDMYNVFLRIKWGSLSPIKEKDMVNAALKDRAQRIRNKEAKGRLSDLVKGVFFAPPGKMQSDLQALAPRVTGLMSLVARYAIAFAAEKQRRNLLDFSDLEHFAIKVLYPNGPEDMTPGPVAASLAAKYHEVLIDEYQDSNKVQDLILSAVAGQRFMVGDVKQSIYRFRRANPGLFVEKYKNFAPLNKTDSGGHGNQFSLQFAKTNDFRHPGLDPGSPNLSREIANSCILRSSQEIPAQGRNDGSLKLISVSGGNGYKNSGDMQSYISDNLRIDLSQNFRSRAGVLDAVNFFFSQLMCEDVGEVSYDSAAALHVGADYPPLPEDTFPGMWVELLDQSAPDTEEEDNEPEEEESAIIAETRMIASCIHEAVSTRQVWDKDKKEYRQCKFGDIVILARSANTLAKDVIEELKNCGIDAIADITAAFYEQIEIKTALAFLRITDNPRQDIDLITALSSPVYGFTPDELLTIKQCPVEDEPDSNEPDNDDIPFKKRPDFYDHLLTFAAASQENPPSTVIPGLTRNPPSFAKAEGIPGQARDDGGVRDDEDAWDANNPPSNKIISKTHRFLHDLKTWRNAATHLPISRLIGFIFETTNYPSHAASMPGGEIRQANLRLLLERAIEFEETSFKGLFHFIHYVESLYSTDSASRISGATAPSSDMANRVRLMSIHKSKGLEFPVVIFGFLGKGFNLVDEKQPLILHGNKGLGPKYVNLQKRTRSKTLAHYALARLTRRENLSEELRCLYVAITRAKELLILTGRTAKWDSNMIKWQEAASTPDILQSVYYRQSTGSYLDWIMPCLLRHRDGASQTDQDIDVHVNKEIYEHPARFDIRVHHGAVQFEPPPIESAFIPASEQPASPSTAKITPLPSKLSISEIKRLYDISPDSTPHQDPPPTFDPPEFIREKEGITPVAMGSALHTIAEHIDFHKHITPESIHRLISELTSKNLLTPEVAAAVDRRKIENMVISPLAGRIRAASHVYRETPFVMAIPAAELYPDLPAVQESILVHGIIDCYFEETDGLTLVDFKSESPGHDTAAWGKAHETQLKIYKKAIEEATGKKVKEVILYSFAIGKGISIAIITEGII